MTLLSPVHMVLHISDFTRPGVLPERSRRMLWRRLVGSAGIALARQGLTDDECFGVGYYSGPLVGLRALRDTRQG